MGCGSCSSKVTKNKVDKKPAVLKKSKVDSPNTKSSVSKKSTKKSGSFVPSSNTGNGIYRATTILQKRIKRKRTKQGKEKQI